VASRRDSQSCLGPFQSRRDLGASDHEVGWRVDSRQWESNSLLVQMRIGNQRLDPGPIDMGSSTNKHRRRIGRVEPTNAASLRSGYKEQVRSLPSRSAASCCGGGDQKPLRRPSQVGRSKWAPVRPSRSRKPRTRQGRPKRPEELRNSE
jgi:hypothetical protein